MSSLSSVGSYGRILLSFQFSSLPSFPSNVDSAFVLFSYIFVETEFLDEIQTKFIRVFLLAIHSHLYIFALKLAQPLTVSAVTVSYSKL